jgi:phosphoribosylanthranilate isomerase
VLDAAVPGVPGGSGTTFDWALARDYINSHRIIIAGGLSADNVGWVIDFLKPYGVDVASGVESAPGKKDPEKLKVFIERVRALEALQKGRINNGISR